MHPANLSTTLDESGLQLRPLSSAQLAIWHAQAIDPTNPIFNGGECLEILGPIDSTLFAEAVRRAVGITDGLNVRFVNTGAGPRQYVQPDPNWTLPVLDVSREENPVSAAHEWMCADMGRADNLTGGLCFTCALLRCAADRYFYYQRAHHILSDGVGAMVFAQRVAQIYSALCAGTELPVQVPGSCFDLLEEEERYRNSDRYERDREYWRGQLSCIPQPVTLSGKPPSRARRTISRRLDVNGDIVGKLAELGRLTGSSLPQLITAATAIYLYRLTGVRDLVLGIPVTGRTSPKMRNIVGFTSNVLPLRVGIHPARSFNDVIPEVARSLRDMLRHQRYRSEDIRTDLGLRATQLNLYGTLVNVMSFDYQMSFGGNTCREYDIAHGPIDDLAILAYDRLDGSELRLSFFANPANYTDDDLIAHEQRFSSMLAALGSSPNLPVHKVDFIGTGERRRVLSTALAPRTRPDVGDSIPALFEQRVALNPNAVAVEIGDESLTYGELNARANRIVSCLLDRGIGRDSVVAIALEPSLALIVSFLAVLKTGAAYLPLQMDWPDARIASIMSDAAPSTTITTAAIASRLDAGTELLKLDCQPICEVDPSSAGRPHATILPDDRACLLYTHSSGVGPAGVVVTHGNVVQLLSATRQLMGFAATETWSSLHSCVSDLSLWEIWGALLHGGRLAILPHTAVRSSSELIRLISKHRITFLTQTPSAYKQLMQAAAGELTLRCVCLRGEPVDGACLADLNRGRRGISPRLFMLFGTAETGVHFIWFDAGEIVHNQLAGTLLGHPFSNVRVYVLDSGLEPAPVGGAGEVYVGGPGLAAGYFKRPSLTAERLIADPHSAEAGARMYRTGDLARWLGDGNLEYLGRADAELNLGGIRVQPAEIEAALTRIEGVSHAAVTVIERDSKPGVLVACVMAQPGSTIDASRVRRDLSQELPSEMIPSEFVHVESVPLTSGGTVDRNVVRAMARSAKDQPTSETERLLRDIWKRVLKLDCIGVNDNFFEIGGDSLLVTRVLQELRTCFKRDIAITDVFHHPSIRSLTNFLEEQTSRPDGAGDVQPARRYRRRAGRKGDHDAVAIIGLSCRFPDAPNPRAFWKNLCAGRESVRQFSDSEMLRAGGDLANRGKPNFVDSGVVLDDLDQFDAGFWGYTPRDAELLDPQHRIFLECCWEALEDAACDPSRQEQLIGVFGGADLSSYMLNLYATPAMMSEIGPFALAVAADKDYLATRVAYKMNLRGPAMTVQTACSSSLVAVCQACKELILGQCDIALAGGSGAATWLESGYLWQEGGILSRDGRCRPFDAGASGTIFGTGVGVVALKRYNDAVSDKDNIYAIIRGFGVNNDGAERVGYTAPGIEGQKQAILSALEISGVDPDTLTYIEAHGTGTKLGDPIEIAALTQVFRMRTQRKQFCGIGSVKSNIGHLGAAAGVAGLIKTALALKNAVLPPSVNFESPNPNIDFDSSPFFVVDKLREWNNGTSKRRAGINSFGIGGTNAHVVLEEAPERPVCPTSIHWQALPLSAKTAGALNRMTSNLVSWLRSQLQASLADVAYTLQVGRQGFQHRRVLITEAGRVSEAAELLERNDPKHVISGTVENTRPGLAFLFPGQGAQYVGMGRALYESQPVFRQEIDNCAAVLAPELGLDIRHILYPAHDSADGRESASKKIVQTEFTQPALFIVEYALARLFMSWSVRPDAMAGHSIGEYVAACLAGVMSAEDALRLVLARGRLMQSVPPGVMLAVHKSEKELVGLLAKDLRDNNVSVAAENSPCLCVLSGPEPTIQRLEPVLSAHSIQHSRLRTSHAFHSMMMDPIVSKFVDLVSHVHLNPPTCRYLSNVTGTWITPEQATDPKYWGRHLRATVRFAQSMHTLQERSHQVLLEVGPGRTLTGLALQCANGNQPTVVNSLPAAQDQTSAFQTVPQAAATLWVNGVEIDLSAIQRNENRFRVSLPSYPFERRSYWVNLKNPRPTTAGRLSSASHRAAFADWFYTPVWKTVPVPAKCVSAESGPWLAIGGDDPVFSDVLEQFTTTHKRITTRIMLGAHSQGDSSHLSVNAADPLAYRDFVRQARPDGDTLRILFWWDATRDPTANWSDPIFGTAPEFYSLMYLSKAIGQELNGKKVELTVVSRGGAQVSPQEQAVPTQAMLSGIVRVIPQEIPQIQTRTIDIPGFEQTIGPDMVRSIAESLLSEEFEAFVALRESGRWSLEYQPTQLDSRTAARRLRKGGVYVISGGLGGMGLTFARQLASLLQARLVLISRSQMPDRTEWPEWLSTHADNDPVSRRIRAMESMDAVGAEVLLISGDVADRVSMENAVERIRMRFGKVNGVIHAAGVAGSNLIQLRTPEKALSVLSPKVRGTQVLYDLFASDGTLDFFVMCSSLAAFLGGFGQSDYAAANSYMDAFANARFAGRTLVTSIAWDAWDEVGMAVETERRNDVRAVVERTLETAMTPAEGVQVLECVLGGDSPRIVVSTRSLAERVQVALQPPTAEVELAKVKSLGAARHPRPNLPTPYAAPRTTTEESIAEIWSGLLGIENIGIHDSFFECGGHSLLAVQLVSQLRNRFEVEIGIAALFEAPTIAEFSAVLQPFLASGEPTAIGTKVDRFEIEHKYL